MTVQVAISRPGLDGATFAAGQIDAWSVWDRGQRSPGPSADGPVRVASDILKVNACFLSSKGFVGASRDNRAEVLDGLRQAAAGPTPIARVAQALHDVTRGAAFDAATPPPIAPEFGIFEITSDIIAHQRRRPDRFFRRADPQADHRGGCRLAPAAQLRGPPITRRRFDGSRRHCPSLGSPSADPAGQDLASCASAGRRTVFWRWPEPAGAEKRFADRGIGDQLGGIQLGPPLLEARSRRAGFQPIGDGRHRFAQCGGGNLLGVGTYTGSSGGSAIPVHKDARRSRRSLRSKTAFAVQAGLRRAQFRGEGVAAQADARRREGGRPSPPPDALAAFRSGAIDARRSGIRISPWRGRSRDAGPHHRRGDRAVLELFPGERRLHRGQPDLVLDILNEPPPRSARRRRAIST